MKQFEYKHFVFFGDPSDSMKVNDFGLEGWELVTAIVKSGKLMHIFKKQLK